ncbi:MAG: hypothetical protein STSR0001_09630 [Methanothrix sp.]|jgi:hypothetical protein
MYYAGVLEYKTSHEAPRRLGELEELRYTLLSVRCEDGQCIANFPNGEFIFPLEMRDELAGMVGQEIACLRLDGKIHVRRVDDA